MNVYRIQIDEEREVDIILPGQLNVDFGNGVNKDP